MKHLNDGACSKCNQIISLYPGFSPALWGWFEAFQKTHPEMHCSTAGRGRIDQEACFARGASRACYGKSSHGFNAALDLFVLIPGQVNIYPREWFDKILAPALPEWISWLGRAGSPFPELPHIEIAAWKDLRDKGLLKLVEPIA